MRVNPTDDERVLLLHAVPAVLSVREGGPVGKGGQNSDEALVASRFLSGHAPPDPTAQMGDQRRPAREPTGPHERHQQGQFMRRSDPGPTPDRIFTVCATASRGCGCRPPGGAARARVGRPPSAPIDHAQTSASPWRSSRQRRPLRCSWCSSEAAVSAGLGGNACFYVGATLSPPSARGWAFRRFLTLTLALGLAGLRLSALRGSSVRASCWAARGG